MFIILYITITLMYQLISIQQTVCYSQTHEIMLKIIQIMQTKVELH